jgi:hypothetical protein
VQVDISIRFLSGSPGCTRSCDWRFLAQTVTITTICGSARSSRSLEVGRSREPLLRFMRQWRHNPTVPRWLLRRKRWHASVYSASVRNSASTPDMGSAVVRDAGQGCTGAGCLPRPRRDKAEMFPYSILYRRSAATQRSRPDHRTAAAICGAARRPAITASSRGAADLRGTDGDQPTTPGIQSNRASRR